MNICMHCGFAGEPEEFRSPNSVVCKECYKKQKRKHNKINREKNKKHNEEYHERNRERINNQKKEHYKKNKEKISKSKKEYRLNNKEKISKKDKKYRLNNQEKIKNRKKEYYKNNRERISEEKKEHYKNNREQIIERVRIYRRKKGELPWTEIKHLRLGLYIEKVIAGMFGVPTEPHNTPDIDFICPNGYKMQVKAASITYSHDNPLWSFKIKKNKVADYFILVAVNDINDIDKKNFKPEHIWMMKGKSLNDKTSTSVRPSRVSKWNKYSIMKEYENKFVDCCNTIKENKVK